MQSGSLPTDRNILFIIEEKHGTTKFMKKDITQIRINSNQLEGGHDLEAKIIGFFNAKLRLEYGHWSHLHVCLIGDWQLIVY